MRLFVYLLEVSAIVVILYGLYRIYFQKETYFSFNRFYLMGVLLLAIVLPLGKVQLELNQNSRYYEPITELNAIASSYHQFLHDFNAEWVPTPSQFKPEVLSESDAGSSLLPGGVKQKVLALLPWFLLGIYVTGLAFFAFRLGQALRHIRRLKKESVLLRMEGLKLRIVSRVCEPFTFWNTIYISQELYETDQFAAIFQHEKTHVMQKHTLDLFIAQSVAVLFWFNPFIWKLLNDIKTTHEYIADKQVIDHGFKLYDYQSLLLNQFIGLNYSADLVHNLNLVSIKKRITMMSKNKSGRLSQMKVLVLVPVVFLVFMLFAEVSCTADSKSSLPTAQELSSKALTAVSLPALDYSQSIDRECALTLTVHEGIQVNGEAVSYADLVAKLAEVWSAVPEADKPKGTVLLNIDEACTMEEVDPVFKALRSNGMLKLFLAAQAPDDAVAGNTYGIALLLPPAGAELKPKEEMKSAGFALHSYALGESPAAELSDFEVGLKAFIQAEPKYVLALDYTNVTSFGSYLKTQSAYRKVFHEVRNAKALALYNAAFDDLSSDQQKEVRSYYPLMLTILNSDDPEIN